MANSKTYRIKANIGSESKVNVNLTQDVDTLELLSLKITSEQAYRMHASHYGCVAGRVLANGALGIPNAKISVFISTEESESLDKALYYLYPYKTPRSTNSDNKRYNLLPEEQLSDCHTPVGSFPSKRMVLDDDNVLEVYDKYYKYTTVTNNAGDYMIFGIPTGDTVLHMDIDLSDIGLLSQKPRDMIYKGYDINQFENANKFKSDENIDSLSQVISQDNSVCVQPFWGDSDQDICITRCDIQVQYKFEPTCIFMGSLVTDPKDATIGSDCKPAQEMGIMKSLITGAGTIEMIRKTADGNVESYNIKAGSVINSDGVWCYQIPMNLDYICTDEYGNIVPSEGTEKGIPTRARVRFRISFNDFESDITSNHLVKMLVPNNPQTYDDVDYVFGTNTLDNDEGSKSFRDLMWNNIYTIKSYIPRFQRKYGGKNTFKNFTGFKNISVNENKLEIPYNNMRTHLSFKFKLQCAIFNALLRIVKVINKIGCTISSSKTCISVGDGMCPQLENWYFAPGCSDKQLSKTANSLASNDANDTTSVSYKNGDTNNNYCVSRYIDYFKQCVEINLALENEAIQFDFYNDWINGLLYIPRWYAKRRKKRKFFFGLFGSNKIVEDSCNDDANKTGYIAQQCALTFKEDGNEDNKGYYYKNTTKIGCRNNKKLRCGESEGRKFHKIFKSSNLNGGGIVHGQETLLGQTVYYPKSTEWTNGDDNRKINLFATDLVLLGNLNDCDENGIPSMINGLVDSTYKMPPALAQNNLGNEGPMYTDGNHGTKCSGKNIGVSKLTVAQDTFEAYQKWASDDESNAEDDVPYPVAEIAGIDWGYSTLPHMTEVDGEYITDDKLFNPGGHFVGIGCNNPEVSIKSCVNLSRVCELGVELSRRHSYLKRKRNSNGKYTYSYDYLIPSGVIAKDEIDESQYRSIFATLNSNGLKTVIDSNTSLRKYTFKPMNINGFNGNLSSSSYFNSKTYNTFITDESDYNNANLFRRTIDALDKDYYNFRMGGTGKDKFMERTNSSVSMPVYNNSFYFYFGLNQGKTAINEFYTNYYANCASNASSEGYLDIVSTKNNLYGYEEYGGKICFEVDNKKMFYTYTLTNIDGNNISSGETVTAIEGEISYDIKVDGDTASGRTNVSDICISGLASGQYSLMISTPDGISVTDSFSIGYDYPDITLDYNISEFTGAYRYSIKSVLSAYSSSTNNIGGVFMPIDSGGTILSWNVYEKNGHAPEHIVYIVIADESFYYPLYFNSDYSSESEKVFEEFIKNTNLKNICDSYTEYFSKDMPARLWQINETYKFYVGYQFEGNDVKYCEVDSYACSEKNETLNVYFGNEDCSYKMLEEMWVFDKPLGVGAISFKTFLTDNTYNTSEGKTWVKTLMEDDFLKKNEGALKAFKYAFSFKNSLFDAVDNPIDIQPSGGTAPYKIEITGKTEENASLTGYYEEYDFSDMAESTNWIEQTLYKALINQIGEKECANNIIRLPFYVTTTKKTTYSDETETTGGIYSPIRYSSSLSPSISDILLPTQNYWKCGWESYSDHFGTVVMNMENGVMPYYYKVTDSANNSIEMYCPSVYRPRFFIAFVSLMTDSSRTMVDKAVVHIVAFNYYTPEAKCTIKLNDGATKSNNEWSTTSGTTYLKWDTNEIKSDYIYYKSEVLTFNEFDSDARILNNVNCSVTLIDNFDNQTETKSYSSIHFIKKNDTEVYNSYGVNYFRVRNAYNTEEEADRTNELMNQLLSSGGTVSGQVETIGSILTNSLDEERAKKYSYGYVVTAKEDGKRIGSTSYIKQCISSTDGYYAVFDELTMNYTMLRNSYNSEDWDEEEDFYKKLCGENMNDTTKATTYYVTPHKSSLTLIMSYK